MPGGLLLMLLQAVAGPPAPVDRRALVHRPCPTEQTEGEVVVCARREAGQRLGELSGPPEPPPLDPLSFRLPGGGKGNVHAIQTELPGAIGQGAAVTLTIPFGKRRKD